MTGVLVIATLFAVIQYLVHLESKSLGQTRKQRRELKAAQEKNRLFWSIRNLEEEVLDIHWCGPKAIR